MDNILESIVDVKQFQQNANNIISQIKFKIKPNVLNNPEISNTIDQLSGTNWQDNLITMHNLKSLLSKTPSDPYLLNLNGYLTNLDQIVANTFSSIQKIQENMKYLRLRGPIKGDPKTQSSIEDYGNLQLVLEKLYENPFDSRSLFYAEKMHARLNDHLYGRTVDKNPEFEEWLNTTQHQPEATFIGQQQTSQQQTPSVPNTDNTISEIDNVANQIVKIFDSNQLVKLIDALQNVSISDEQGNYDNINSLISILNTHIGQSEESQENSMQPEVNEESTVEEPAIPNVSNIADQSSTTPVATSRKQYSVNDFESTDWDETEVPELSELDNDNNKSAQNNEEIKLIKVATKLELILDKGHVEKVIERYMESNSS